MKLLIFKSKDSKVKYASKSHLSEKIFGISLVLSEPIHLFKNLVIILDYQCNLTINNVASKTNYSFNE